MDILDTINNTVSNTYNDLDVLDPNTILYISSVGLIMTLVFVFIFRKRLKDTYGEKIYVWFMFLIAINIINIIFIAGYYKMKYNTKVGEQGDKGDEGIRGPRGKPVICSVCKPGTEIGIQYSDNYFTVAKITKTTNILGEIGIYRAVGMLGLAALGDTVIAQVGTNKIRTYLAGFGSQPPKGFDKLIELSDGMKIITLWQPIPPPGYTYVGHFATTGKNPPDVENVACLPTECLVKSNNLLYVCSFPAIDIIPRFTAEKRTIQFCSFWRTPLNHMYCKVSNGIYTTNSVYYNLVDGSPEFYDAKKRLPIAKKYEEIKQFLSNKASIIVHVAKSERTEFNNAFIQKTRNTAGKITETQINGYLFNKLIEDNNTFETYLTFYQNAIVYINNVIKEATHPVIFVPDATKSGKTMFQALTDKLTALKKTPNEKHLLAFINFISAFKQNPQVAIKLFQDPGQSFGISQKEYIKMNFQERVDAISILVNDLTFDKFIIINDKLDGVGLAPKPQESFEFLEKFKKKDEVSGSYQGSKEIEQLDTSLSMWDDLYYLFPSGLDEQIAADENAALEGGYYLDDIAYRQHKNFIDYVKTFIKPMFTTYSFRKKCLMMIDIDPKRNEIINNLSKVYDAIQQELRKNSDTCDNQTYIDNYYKAMVKRIDAQFRTINDYKIKLQDKEYSYFPTSRLQWLLNEMNKYYTEITNNCKGDERLRIISQIKILRDQLEKQFWTTIDLTEETGITYKRDQEKTLKPNLNTKIFKLDVSDLTLVQLKEILEIYRAKINTLIEERKISREDIE